MRWGSFWSVLLHNHLLLLRLNSIILCKVPYIKPVKGESWQSWSARQRTSDCNKFVAPVVKFVDAQRKFAHSDDWLKTCEVSHKILFSTRGAPMAFRGPHGYRRPTRYCNWECGMMRLNKWKSATTYQDGHHSTRLWPFTGFSHNCTGRINRWMDGWF